MGTERELIVWTMFSLFNLSAAYTFCYCGSRRQKNSISKTMMNIFLLSHRKYFDKKEFAMNNLCNISFRFDRHFVCSLSTCFFFISFVLLWQFAYFVLSLHLFIFIIRIFEQSVFVLHCIQSQAQSIARKYWIFLYRLVEFGNDIPVRAIELCAKRQLTTTHIHMEVCEMWETNEISTICFFLEKKKQVSFIPFVLVSNCERR